jgi:hypothetical protein
MSLCPRCLLGVSDPCQTCSSRYDDPNDRDTYCYNCGSPEWEYHDVFFAADGSGRLEPCEHRRNAMPLTIQSTEV